MSIHLKVVKASAEYRKLLGKRIKAAIRAAGYASVYDYWLHEGEDVCSRSALNRIVAGDSDPKISTLHALAHSLKIPLSKLIP